MADNSTPETSTDKLSFSDAVASIYNDPETENRVIDEAAEAEELDPAEMLEADEAEAELEADQADDEAEAEDAEGDDDSDDQEDEDADQEPELYTVKVDGEEIEVDLETLKSGFMMQSAFTKRTQEIAAQRKQLEAETYQAREARDQYAHLAQQALQNLQATRQEPDWNRLKEELDPKEYADAIYLHQQRQQQEAEIQQQLAHIDQEREREAQHNFAQHMQQEKAAMLEAIPEWRNDEVRSKERAAVMQYAKKLGYSQDEIAQAADHRAIKMLRDSWLLSQINSKAPAAKKKVRQAPKVAKAGTPTTKAEGQSRRQRELRNRFDKERSFNAAVEYMLNQNQ